jgi:hypothetical protein
MLQGTMGHLEKRTASELWDVSEDSNSIFTASLDSER